MSIFLSDFCLGHAAGNPFSVHPTKTAPTNTRATLTGVVLFVIAKLSIARVDDQLTLCIGSLVLCWFGLVVLFYGFDAFRQFLFSLLFLLRIPIPKVVVDKCALGLEVASTEATGALFRLAEVPVLMRRYVWSIPGLDLEIASSAAAYARH